MRRKSNRTTHRSSNRDPLDDLEYESRHTRNEPTPLVRVSGPARTSKLEDRRRWAPGLRAQLPRQEPRDTSGRKARISHQPTRVVRGRIDRNGKKLQSSYWLETSAPRFADARKTMICLKRKVRAQVLHALKRTRAGKGAPKKRNEFSDVRC